VDHGDVLVTARRAFRKNLVRQLPLANKGRNEMSDHEVKFPGVVVQLTERDGNAFAVIGAVRAALGREVSHEAATAYTDAAMQSESYDALLRLTMSTVTVL
jgi:hypothetical protein